MSEQEKLQEEFETWWRESILGWTTDTGKRRVAKLWYSNWTKDDKIAELDKSNAEKEARIMKLIREPLLEGTRNSLKELIDVHREKAGITCPETCWCWEIECIVNNIELHSKQVEEPTPEQFYQVLGFRVSNHGFVEKLVDVDNDDSTTPHKAWCAPNANDLYRVARLAFNLWLSNHELETKVKELEDAYNELIYAVGTKYPDETRHQTALRYIRKAEQPEDCGDTEASQSKGQQP